jgi:hypothetical protein
MKVQNKDLELAKQKVIEENLSLVVVKNGKILFKTQKQGIAGFLEAIERLGENMVTASAADKIVGVAAAKLCLYSGVASVFALTISEEGVKVLKDGNIAYYFEKTVPNILNRDKKEVCPFEKVAMASGSPEETYFELKSCTKQEMMKNKSSRAFK